MFTFFYIYVSIIILAALFCSHCMYVNSNVYLSSFIKYNNQHMKYDIYMKIYNIYMSQVVFYLYRIFLFILYCILLLFIHCCQDNVHDYNQSKLCIRIILQICRITPGARKLYFTKSLLNFPTIFCIASF